MGAGQQETLIRVWRTALRLAALFALLGLSFFVVRTPLHPARWQTELAAFGDYRIGAPLRIDDLASVGFSCYTYTDVPSVTPYDGSSYFSCRKFCSDCAHVRTLAVFGRDDQIVQMTYTVQDLQLGDLAAYFASPETISAGKRTGWAIWDGGRLRAMLADVDVDRYHRRVLVIRIG
jgi:hypothetical protein